MTRHNQIAVAANPHTRGFCGGPRASQMIFRGWRRSGTSGIGILATLFHFVDGRVGERRQYSEVVATDGLSCHFAAEALRMR